MITGCHYRGVHYPSGSEWSDPEDPCQVYIYTSLTRIIIISAVFSVNTFFGSFSFLNKQKKKRKTGHCNYVNVSFLKKRGGYEFQSAFKKRPKRVLNEYTFFYE